MVVWVDGYYNYMSSEYRNPSFEEQRGEILGGMREGRWRLVDLAWRFAGKY